MKKPNIFNVISNGILLVFYLILSQNSVAQLVVTATITESRCSADGSITVQASGGVEPYRYRLDTLVSAPAYRALQNSPNFTALPARTYRVVVIDAQGTEASIQVIVAGNYKLPTLTATVNCNTVRLQVSGGRFPLRYFYTRAGVSSDTIDTPVFSCLPNGSYRFWIIDSCRNFYPYDITVNAEALDFTARCDNGTVSVISTKGCSKPFTYILKNNRGDSLKNQTGTFSGFTGCSFTLTMRDSCGKELTKNVDCPIGPFKISIACANHSAGTATITASGGLPPYIYRCITTVQTNTTGVFTGLPLKRRYEFEIEDACGRKKKAWIDPLSMYGSTGISYNSCPFDSILDVKTTNIYWEEDMCFSQTFGCNKSFQPVTYTCETCTPNISTVGTNYISGVDNGKLMGLPPGTHRIVIRNACGDTLIRTVKMEQGKMSLYVYGSCSSTNAISAYSSTSNTTFILKMGNTELGRNQTGDFTIPDPDTLYTIIALNPLCDSTSTTYRFQPSTETRYEILCDYIRVSVCPNIGGYTFTLKDRNGSILTSNITGIFTGLQPNTVYQVTTNHPNLNVPFTHTVTTNGLPEIRVFDSNIGACSFTISVLGLVKSQQSALVTFKIYDALTNQLILTTTSTDIIGLQPNRIYRVIGSHPYCGERELRVTTKNLTRPNLCVSPDVGFFTCGFVCDVSGVPSSSYAVRLPQRDTIRSFSNLPPATYLLASEGGCQTDTLRIPNAPTDFLRVTARASCPQTGGIMVSGLDSLWQKWAQHNAVRLCGNPRFYYYLFDSTGTL